MGHVVGLLVHLVAFHVDFFSRSSTSQKNDMAKILGLFDIRKVPKSQKHKKNKKICFAVLEPNERGSFRKSSKSMENMSRFL
jgi:hypothetical protein